MKKFKKIAYVLLIGIIIILGFVIYSISASDISEDINEKTKSEILYFESKFIYIFNSLNNIEYQNYKISTEDISEKSKKSSENSSSAGNGDDSSGGSSQEDSSSGEEEKSSSKSEGNNSAEKTKKYSLNAKGILNSEDKINWDYIKNEAEMLNSSLSTLTMDLYKINQNNNDVLSFSKEYDNLLISIKNEDKEQSLKQLVTLYSYIPKFLKNCNIDLQTEIVYSTKYSIFKAYSIIDSENWNEISNNLQEANNKFSKLLTDVNIQNKNQYVVNKCYIMINELINASNIKDKEIFLIKYRNLLEDLNNL